MDKLFTIINSEIYKNLPENLKIYLYEVEKINKLVDIFTRTPQQGISTSSKSIIANLIVNFNQKQLKP